MNTLVTDTYIDKQIKEYFRTNLSQYCEGDDAWEIHWSQTKSFTRPDDLYWMDFFFLPGIPVQQELGTTGRNRWTGIMQINICVPKDSDEVTEDDPIGTSMLDKVYDDIAVVFKRGVIFNGIRISKCCKNSSALQIYDDFCCLPVTIYWQADLAN